MSPCRPASSSGLREPDGSRPNRYTIRSWVATQTSSSKARAFGSAPVNTTLDSWISSGTRRAISGSAHELFVRQDGPIGGKPVTLLHGFPTSSFDWAGGMPHPTGTGYRVTTLDFLGYGSSDKPY